MPRAVARAWRARAVACRRSASWRRADHRAVRDNGDAALRELTARYDVARWMRSKSSEAEFDAAEAALDSELKAAIHEAAERIDAFHRAPRRSP
jgi:histidinol dehydrogenase